MQRWVQAVRRKSWQPTPHSFICSEHFLPSDFLTGYVNRRQLKDDAVPSVFSYPQHLKVVIFVDIDYLCMPNIVVEDDKTSFQS